MKILTSALAAAVVLSLSLPAIAAPTHKAKHKSHKITKHVRPPAHPKNEVTKVDKARKEDHTVRQVTPDPKKSPGKHADNLSKNVNHELNRESKDINHFFQGKKKK